ncbi:MAG: sigma 54-interacting transcriptional regulator [Planctomycetes bacterium]|nr:sigma 54-interacting transcriptional regulator [Planctomycetota bacterium]
MAESDLNMQVPEGYALLRVLAQGTQGTVMLCERGARPVVVRSIRAGAARDALAELRVLSALEHPQLARLVDHGLSRTPGEVYFARTWIDGHTLDQHLAALPATGPAREREVARVFAGICDGLQALHDAGFVHADLKPGNVLVRLDGLPVLTDFGLASALGRSRADGEVAGSLATLAPEQLSGGVLDARTDLFALGAMLYDALAPRARDLGRFYARFPAQDFFVAAGGELGDLCEWARTLVGELLLRDPTQRPASASLVAARLRASVGGAHGAADTQRWVWPPSAGRRAWFEDLLDRLLSTDGQTSGVFQIALSDDEGGAALVEELRLAASLRGARAMTLDPRTDLRASASARDLDQWCERALERGEGALLLAALPAREPLGRRALEYLARTLIAGGDSHGTRLALLGLPIAPAGEGWLEPWIPPAVGIAELRLELARGFDASAHARLDELTAVLWAQSRGLAPAVQAWLDAARAAGVLLRGEGGWRIAGSLAAVDPAHGLAEQLEGDARVLAIALEVCGPESDPAELCAIAGLDPQRFEGAAEELRNASLLDSGADSQPVWTLRGRAPAESCPGERRAQHAARAVWLAQHGEPDYLVRLHGLLGARDAKALAAFFEALATLRDRGLPERALEACARARREYETEGMLPPPELLAEEAHAWASLGELERARSLIEAMPSGTGGSGEAARERALGTICARSYEHAQALEHFTRAAELDPAQAGEAALGRALVLYETRREGELAAFLDSLAGPGRRPFQARTEINLDMLRALSLIRVGQFEPAEELLERRRAAAADAGDALAEAAAQLNLGTLRRRQGNHAEAQRCFERAAERSEAAGALAGVAQARALLGVSLREAGELGRAQPLLESALLIRERLGDQGGARLVRGMLGMLLADRGRVLPALAELGRSAAALEAAGRPADALLPRARAVEVAARLRPLDAQPALMQDSDPRVLLLRARAESYGGRAWGAIAGAQRALEIAEHLGQAAVALEARDLLALLRLDAQVSNPDERALLELLGKDSWSEGDRRRLRSTAEAFERTGRDDRAARAWLGLAARLEDAAEAQGALARADRLLSACTAGLLPTERARFELSLLGRPDPWPRDISRARNRAQDEEFDMDMLKILEINHRLVLQEDLPGLLGTIVESALSVSGGERGFLVLAEKGELRIDTAFDSRRGGMDEPELELSRSIVRRALEEGKPLRFSNASDDPDLGAAPSVTALELRSILCVPFVIDEQLSGVVYVDHRVRAGAFAERAERLLSLLADQAALAIRQVRRTERIRELNLELNREVVRKESDLRTARAVIRHAQLAVPPSGLVGSSPAMRRVHQLIERAAPARLPVLVSGASGTGKELAARALHALSPRKDKPFVSENCAAFPASLIEAELFGSRKGAFTGSEEDRQGLFERADGGTLFLDELGELPLELQAKLLRVIETSEVRRLGDTRVREVDIRLVAATNRDLEAEVRGGRFRADLYYRLDGMRIELPTLAERVEDVPELVDHFLRLESVRSGRVRAVSPAVLAALCRREWQGNVRELSNEIARLCVLSEGDLEDAALVREPGSTRLDSSGEAAAPIESLDAVERRAIERAVAACGGDKTKAAELLGISRAKVYQRWKEWYG